MTPDILRLAAFSGDPAGGNPAGVVLDAAGLSDAQMQQIAADVGYSETAFIVGGSAGHYTIRYFSPLAEVAFCGHATIATGVALAERDGPGRVELATAGGPVPVETGRDAAGRVTATLTSVPPAVHDLGDADLEALLSILGWSRDDLDPQLPPRVGYAGAFHPILPVAQRSTLAALGYDFERAADLMAARDWTTLQLFWRESELRFHSRNPFPPGGVVEDPATGAAAAAFGAYLRELGAVTPPATVTILQGDDMGRPGVLTVGIAADRPGIDVTGTAVPISG
jgi:PhzF family phenazine biosynthesis protein